MITDSNGRVFDYSSSTDRPYAYRGYMVNDEVTIYVDFETMMQQDAGGYITIKLGEHTYDFRRVRDPEKKIKADLELNKPLVSENLGFGFYQLDEHEAFRQRHGFMGVEFKPDPRLPQYYNVHFSGPAERERYIRARGMADGNSRNGSGAGITPDELAEAQRRAIEKYGPPQKSDG